MTSKEDEESEKLVNSQDVHSEVVGLEGDEEGLVVEVHRAPLYFRNPFIHGGYRVHYSFWGSLRSVLRLHNETLNIWTSLVPAAWFLFQLVALPLPGRSDASPDGRTALLRYRLQAQMAACYAAALLAIAGFHTFHCMSHGAKKWLSALDYGAIALISYASFLPSVELWAVWHHHDAHRLWGSANAALTVGSSVLCCFESIRESRLLRTLVFTALAALPFVVNSRLQQAFPEHPALALLQGHLVELAGTILLGVVFFLVRIPERFRPGRCDIVFNSHHFWHASFAIATARFWSNTPTIFELI